VIELRVRCGACGAPAAHPVGAVLLDEDEAAAATDTQGWTRAVYVPVSLTCPSCGAVDEHRVEPDSGRALEVDGEVVMAGRAALSDGTPIHTPTEGLRILEERAAAAPTDPARWRALGNFATRAGRTDEAMVAYRRGAEIEGELSCALLVATDAVARGLDGAPGELARALRRAPAAEPRARLLQAAQLAELVRRLGPSAPAFTIDGQAVEPAEVRDWQRLGERLASAEEVRA